MTFGEGGTVEQGVLDLAYGAGDGGGRRRSCHGSARIGRVSERSGAEQKGNIGHTIVPHIDREASRSLEYRLFFMGRVFFIHLLDRPDCTNYSIFSHVQCI